MPCPSCQIFLDGTSPHELFGTGSAISGCATPSLNAVPHAFVGISVCASAPSMSSTVWITRVSTAAAVRMTATSALQDGMFVTADLGGDLTAFLTTVSSTEL